jgi:hypothetical protein
MFNRRLFSGLVLTGVVLVASCGGEQSGQPATTSTAPTPTTTLAETTTSRHETTTTLNETTTTSVDETTTTSIGVTTTTEADLLPKAIAAFQEWVAAVAMGDTERAWDLMASPSQDALGSYERFERMSSGIAEGWGSWVVVEDASYSLKEDEAGRPVLFASGVVHPEGNTEYREVSVPVVIEDGKVRVSPFEELGT